MARIAFAWELGGEYGHVMSCAGLARGLDTRGHRIAFMFRELRQLAVIPESKNYDVYQAPRTPREGENAPLKPQGYPDILIGCGYRDPRELIAMLGGWRSLLARWKPDLLVVDFGPTALLAARILGIPCVTFGNGFFLPPRVSPLPPFRIDEPVDMQEVARADALVLASVNTALAHFGHAPLLRLADMFASSADFLCTFPEIDHYGSREVSGYWGPRVRFDRGADVAWPQGAGKRVFVYVKRELPQLDALIDVLAGSPHRIVAYIPELDAARRARLTGRNRVYSDKPLKLEHFLKGCDLLVSHGGEIAAGALMYGVPALLFPTHYEQYLTARRLQKLGAAFWCGPGATKPDVVRGYTQLLADNRYKASAQAFARRYSAFSPAEQRRRIILAIEGLLAGGGAILSPPSNSQGPER